MLRRTIPVLSATAVARLWSHIVVGAGTAGCLLAARLADASPENNVLLLEGGRCDRGVPQLQVPVGYLACIGNPETDWMYTTEPCAGLNQRALKYPRGKALGGCSSINGMLYLRGQRRDFDSWARITGEAAWGWDELLPYFKRHERHWRAGDDAAAAHHGFDGELDVERQRLHWPVLDDLRDAACSALQLPVVDDFNTGDNLGVGYFEVTQRNGRRWSSASAFLFNKRGSGGPLQKYLQDSLIFRWCKLPTLAEIFLEGALHYDMHRRPVGLHRAPDRANLTIGLGYVCDKVLLSPSNVCTGVEAIADGTKSTFSLDGGGGGEVILSAGAVATPLVLMRSGIGDESQLRQHGITTRAALPGVGRNLQDHLQIRTVYRLDSAAAKGATLNTKSRDPIALVKMARDFSFRGIGPLTMAPSQLGCFAKSNPAQEHANVEFHIQPLSLDAFGQPLHDFDGVTVSVCNLNPKSTGTVSLRDADPASAPLIQPNYLEHEDDKRVAVESVGLARAVAAEKRFVDRYAPVEVKPGAAVASADDLIRAVGDISTTIFHPACTCRMGPDGDEGAVLTPRLSVRHVTGLRVCDASAMPHLPSGNTNEPVLVMAERLASWLCDGTDTAAK